MAIDATNEDEDEDMIDPNVDDEEPDSNPSQCTPRDKEQLKDPYTREPFTPTNPFDLILSFTAGTALVWSSPNLAGPLELLRISYTCHGRTVKFCSPDEPLPATGGQEPRSTDIDTRGKVDCIAIFGTQNSDTVSAMVIRKVLFGDAERNADLGKKTYSNKAVSRGMSRMTLFLVHDCYDHLLVLLNLHGQGMVWDWVKEKQVTQQHMPIDVKSTDDAALPPRRGAYYWGV
ncbi:hypothetical protein BGW39_002400 [Mortierella sp. 14UC]|nr:hypothetical protein BGW39_002400 [Mortierella sp. 14UC]